MSDEEKKKGSTWIHAGEGWFVEYEHTDTRLDFRVFQPMRENYADEVFFRSKSAPETYTNTTTDVESTIEGFVKWDGCMEITKNARRHFCGSDDIIEHAFVLQALHALCLLLPSIDRGWAGYEEGDEYPILDAPPEEDIDVSEMPVEESPTLDDLLEVLPEVLKRIEEVCPTGFRPFEGSLRVMLKHVEELKMCLEEQEPIVASLDAPPTVFKATLEATWKTYVEKMSN